MQEVIANTAIDTTVAGAELAVEGTVAATKGIGALAMAGVEVIKANPFIALGAATAIAAGSYFGFKGVKAFRAKRAEKNLAATVREAATAVADVAAEAAAS